MTAEFHDFGLRFLYPENWSLVHDAERSGPRSISVHSPQGAFWAVTVDSWPSDDLLTRVVESIRQEYEDVEVERVERAVGTHRLRGLELRFYCLDLLVTAQVLDSDAAERPMVFLLQGENRDFEELLRVFDAITLSCLQHITASAADDR